MGKSKFSGNIATNYGLKSEPIARNLYQQVMMKQHTTFKVINSGLVINDDNPLIRASPDGVVSCKCCGTGILEIKCLANLSLQKLTGEEIAHRGDYHIKMEGEQVKLKESSPWFTQIQCALGVTKYSWCDFVLFTQKAPRITVQRIFFDSERYNMKIERALGFHNKYIMPKLVSLQQQ